MSPIRPDRRVLADWLFGPDAALQARINGAQDRGRKLSELSHVCVVGTTDVVKTVTTWGVSFYAYNTGPYTIVWTIVCVPLVNFQPTLGAGTSTNSHIGIKIGC